MGRGRNGEHESECGMGVVHLVMGCGWVGEWGRGGEEEEEERDRLGGRLARYPEQTEGRSVETVELLGHSVREKKEAAVKF